MAFGPVELTLKSGSGAALQFSLYLDKQQLNLALQPLYDHAVVSIEPSGFGLIIKALNPGETVLQTLTEQGFQDIAYITVIP
jgi:hypothetical protein